MGMFDKPQYLTGDNGFVSEGETFLLHNARLDGTVKVNGEDREQVKLQVSREGEDALHVVYTSGRGIVGQVKRMDRADLDAMPMLVRLDSIPATAAGRNPTNVLTPATEPPPGNGTSDGDIPF